MSNLCKELEFKFKNIERNIEQKINYANTLYEEQIKLLLERYELNRLLAKYQNNLNNERDRLIKENSRQTKIEIELVNALNHDLKKKIQTKSFFDDILTFIEKIKQNQNLISIQKKSHMCFQKLLNKEFKFQMVFDASKLTKYQHILGIEDYFNKKTLYNLYYLDNKFWKAIKNQDLVAAGLFIEAGAEVDSKNEYHQTALIYASERGLFELVKFLLKNGANINASNASLKKPKFIKTSDFILTSVFGQLAQYMMNNDKDFLFNKAFLCIYDYYGKTPLLSASKQGHYEIVEYLVSNSADLNSRDENGNTALLLASERGHFQIVEYLMKKGCDVNTRNLSEYTALFFATAQGNCERVEYFVKNGADVNAKNKDNQTALMFAALNGNFEIVYYLVENKALVDLKDKDKNTALNYASRYEHNNIMNYLAAKKS